MKTSTAAGLTTTYSYNGLGERVMKTSSASTTYFAYDEAGHVIGEYDAAGDLIQEHVWLGDIPVAVLKPSGSGIDVFYVHVDHLSTPRRITRPSDNAIVWRWDSDPFGTTAADEDPDDDTVSFAFQLRFPGQYFDAETELHYNYFRDYDAATGRYIESDPIGLEGGLNTYAYAGGDPVGYVDPLGLSFDSLSAACMHDPAFCVENGLLAGDGAVARSGDACFQERWQESRQRMLRAAQVAGAVAAVAGAAAATRAIAKRLAARATEGGGRAVTDFVADATVVSHGKVIGRGIVDVRATVEGIQSGRLAARDVFRNAEGLLPSKPAGYYREFVHPTPGVSSAGPQRIVAGQGGELYYTPDHYRTFIPLN